MNGILTMEHVRVSFKETLALKDVSLQIKEGEIFGFLGPSGAGKTTTIKLLTKQLHATQGNITIFGKDVNAISNDELYQNIGVLSDNSGFYEKMSVYDNLKVFADIQRLPYSTIDEVLQKTGLYEHRKKKAKLLSKGMKQRLLFSRAILNKPKVLFLDEPTSALDPATSEAVYEMIFELNKNGTTIFLTTHNMNEADLLCDRVAFLNHGEIVELGNPDELKLKHAKNEIVILDDQRKEHYVKRTKKDIIQALETMDGDVLRMASIEPDLKTIFLNITGREL